MRLLSARPKKTEELRRRRYGFVLTFAGLIGLFFVVRTIPADWEIGPFRIDTSGAIGPQASLYLADDPRAPFWLLVPTFNLPPRFFASRPNSSPRPIALGPTASATPSSSAAPTTSATPSSSASTSPSASPSPTPSARPTPTPTPTPAFAITSASESLVSRGQCGEGTLTATGKFTTNGAGGTVVYYWVRNGAAQPRQSKAISKGDTSTKVITDTWTPNSAGSEQLVFVGPSYPTQTQSFSCTAG